MEKKQMRVGIRSWISLFFVTALLVTTLHTTRIHAEVVNPEDKQAYKEALIDAETTTQAKIFRGLLAVVPRPDETNYLRLHGDEIRWNKEGEIKVEGIKAGTRVLVVSFMSEVDWKRYYADYINTETPLALSLWVTVAPELKNFFVGKECPATKERTIQALGLHPVESGDEEKALVEMWVDPKILFRPSPDPEITDHEAELANRIDASIWWEYPSDQNAFLTLDDSVFFLESAWSVLGNMTFQEWYENRTVTIYNTSGDKVSSWGYPWTRLGYTYDWGNKDNHVGLSEFIIRIDPDKKSATVIPEKGIVHGSAEWNEYFRCGPGSPMLSATTSEAGLSLSWTTVSGADGYNLRFKEAQRGTPFTPPFADDATYDLGNTDIMDIPLPSGSCYYVSVQSYDDRGAGGLSNIAYVYVP